MFNTQKMQNGKNVKTKKKNDSNLRLEQNVVKVWVGY